MEEILASIRKIIAEEPIGSRPGPSPSNADGTETPSPVSGAKGLSRGNDPVLPLPSRGDAPADDRAYSVEEALSELMNDPPQRGTPLGRDETASKPPEEEKRGGWLFGRQPSAPSNTQQPTSPAGSGFLGGGLFGQLGSARQAPERSATDPGTGSGRAESAPPSGSAPAGAAPAGERSRDGGRSGLADFLARPFGPSHEIPKPAAPRFPAPEGEASGGNQAGQAHAPVTAPRSGAAVEAARPAGSALGSASPAVQRPDAAGSIGPAAGRPASSPQPESVRAEKAGPAHEAPRVKDVPSKEGHPEAPRAPAASSATAASPVPTPAATPAPQPRTLEDTVVELLRPMLREWLDVNLPRIVEKALRAEMAERAKSQNPGGNSGS